MSPYRGHRRGVFKYNYSHTGVAVGCHGYYGEVACIMFAGRMKEGTLNAPQITRTAPASDRAACNALTLTESAPGDTTTHPSVGTTYSKMSLDIFNAINTVRTNPAGTSYSASANSTTVDGYAANGPLPALLYSSSATYGVLDYINRKG